MRSTVRRSHRRLQRCPSLLGFRWFSLLLRWRRAAGGDDAMIRRRRAISFAAGLSIAIACPRAHAAIDLSFDYTSFETGFGQAQFDVLNYRSINGNYMMTSTDNHRPEMVANGNALAQFYNN